MDETKREGYIRRIENVLKADVTEITHEIFFTEEATREILELLKEQPERPKGEWVEIGDEPYDEWECDVCGCVIDGSGCVDPEGYRDIYRFCPRCGSYMR